MKMTCTVLYSVCSFAVCRFNSLDLKNFDEKKNGYLTSHINENINSSY